MDWWKRMNTVLDYIEDNLDGDIQDNKIAALFASSRGMFQRVFTIITEMNLSEYIRKRRLTQAASDIRNTDAKIIDIAVKYGYDSPKAFSSAFKSFHGITPSEARASGVKLQAFRRFTFALTLTITGGNDMQYRIIENAEDTLQKVSATLECFLVTDFNEGLAPVGRPCGEIPYTSWEFGFMDKTGKIVIPLEYDGAFPFSEGLAAVNKDGKLGFIDKTNTAVIPFDYSAAAGGSFIGGIASVWKDGKCGAINKANETVIPFEYDDWLYISDNDFMVTRKNGKTGVIDINNKIIIPFGLYDNIDSSSNGIARAEKGQLWGYVDKTGKIIAPIEHNLTTHFNEGLACVCKDGKWSYLDATGSTILTVDYERACHFSDGLAWVCQDGKWGCIDKSGNVVLPLIYQTENDSYIRFENGLSFIKKEKEGKYGLIDKTGTVILPFEYDLGWQTSDGFMIVQKDGEWGIIDVEKLKA